MSALLPSIRSWNAFWNSPGGTIFLARKYACIWPFVTSVSLMAKSPTFSLCGREAGSPIRNEPPGMRTILIPRGEASPVGTRVRGRPFSSFSVFGAASKPSGSRTAPAEPTPDVLAILLLGESSRSAERFIGLARQDAHDGDEDDRREDREPGDRA